MAKTQSRKTASRSAVTPWRTRLASRASAKTTKVATAKKSSSAPARSLDQPVKHRAGSKQARVIEMLMKPEGTTIGDIMKATDWQQHSVRGFFASVVRKKLKLDLDSELVDKVRRYRIKPAADEVGKSAKAA
jgi:hypothetical protein